ncbi:MarR family transcriptional regulator [Marinilongibacter aquaticus]|uniref:GbsR/MarR family transcriptional regulator n=1 Tax=Marinilongibacter aquaticus TaxID=2975157 RepID=UPI0021BD8054|nr:MarR family transcriptional regulator [Marinilongibacter aquaticus]UBM59133.1 MarR family transcriptional regulator [Marinilongibacter aquaticus]
MTNEISLSEKQKELIQIIGVSLEHTRFAPAEARIVALLMVAPQTEVTFDEIRDTLGISKSATSNAVNKLLLLGEVEYITKHGDRKRYFRYTVQNWKEKTKKAFQDLNSMQKIMRQVLESRPGSTTEFNQALRDQLDFMDYVMTQLPILFEKWSNKE